ncbi:MAG: PD-(D/E)XK nuclease domain-containing protein [Lachnospiraceae bacterium]|nr:PD-(D/E)XK nuclease domain-containing protein [Lachnospiraceae bacterium]
MSSNIEVGYGRSDITLESKMSGHPSIIVEFKQGVDLERLKEAALQQIMDNQYYAGLRGNNLCWAGT